jgi:hypothetical protein
LAGVPHRIIATGFAPAAEQLPTDSAFRIRSALPSGRRKDWQMIRLYRVKTVVEIYHGHRDVAFHWFACCRRRPLPYAELIAGYDEADDLVGYAELLLDELFDRAEAEALVAYLEREYRGGETTIEEVNLPIARNIMGYGAKAVGGNDDFFTLDKQAGYSLPFRVWAYYNLKGCEPVDKSVPARHQFPSIVVIDGKIITDYGELLNLWRAGKLVAADEIPAIRS